MCDWEEFIFGCQCTYTKRKNYCHFARNDPNHQCFGVQVLKKVWDIPEACEKCCSRRTATNGWGNQCVAQGTSEYFGVRDDSMQKLIAIQVNAVVVEIERCKHQGLQDRAIRYSGYLFETLIRGHLLVANSVNVSVAFRFVPIGENKPRG